MPIKFIQSSPTTSVRDGRRFQDWPEARAKGWMCRHVGPRTTPTTTFPAELRPARSGQGPNAKQSLTTADRLRAACSRDETSVSAARPVTSLYKSDCLICSEFYSTHLISCQIPHPTVQRRCVSNMGQKVIIWWESITEPTPSRSISHVQEITPRTP